MTYIQRYEPTEQLPTIACHYILSDSQKKMGEVTYTQTKGKKSASKNYTFVKQGDHLSILVSKENTIRKTYSCYQYDYPLRVLSWFTKTLEAFRNGVAFKGNFGGAMTTPHLNVDGEFLSIDRGSQGYSLNNWSRDSQSKPSDGFFPVLLSLDEALLYDQGLLALWKELGKKYDTNKI